MAESIINAGPQADFDRTIQGIARTGDQPLRIEGESGFFERFKDNVRRIMGALDLPAREIEEAIDAARGGGTLSGPALRFVTGAAMMVESNRVTAEAAARLGLPPEALRGGDTATRPESHDPERQRQAKVQAAERRTREWMGEDLFNRFRNMSNMTEEERLRVYMETAARMGRTLTPEQARAELAELEEELKKRGQNPSSFSHEQLHSMSHARQDHARQGRGELLDNREFMDHVSSGRMVEAADLLRREGGSTQATDLVAAARTNEEIRAQMISMGYDHSTLHSDRQFTAYHHIMEQNPDVMHHKEVRLAIESNDSLRIQTALAHHGVTLTNIGAAPTSQVTPGRGERPAEVQVQPNPAAKDPAVLAANDNNQNGDEYEKFRQQMIAQTRRGQGL